MISRLLKCSLESGKNLHYCLFFCHLVIEKHLKALVVRRTSLVPPRTHDLEKLAKKAGLDLPVTDLDFLTEMTGFNLESRYPDERLKIYRRATPEMTRKLFNKTIEIKKWIRKLVKQ